MKHSGWTIETALRHLLSKIKDHDKADQLQISALDRRLTDAINFMRSETTAAFTASREAIKKAEAAQADYNVQHNGLQRQIEAQYKLMVPKSESLVTESSRDKEIAALVREVALLRDFKSTTKGHSEGAHAFAGYVVGALGLIVAGLAIFLRST